MNIGKIIAIAIAVIIFIFFVANTDFSGMDLREIIMILRIYGIFAAILGGVITIRAGENKLTNMFIGTAVTAIVLSILLEGC